MAEIKAQLSLIVGHLATAKAEEIKLSGGCKASAARCRNALLEIGKICSETRKDVLEVGKAVQTKKRIPKDPEEVKPDPEPESEEEKTAEPVPPKDLLPSIGEIKSADILEALRVSDAASLVVAAPVKKPRAPRAKKAVVVTPA